MNLATPLDIPRWEWRTFAPSLANLSAFLPVGADVRCEDAHEICFLCPCSLHEVLIRGHVLQLRWRKQVGPEGLELWDTVFHSAFPIPAEVVLRLFEVWGTPAPHLLRPDYSEAQFLQEVVPECPDLRAVHIHACSKSFFLDGAGCQLIELSTNQGKLDCFCIEHEDPGLALQVIRRLGLQPWANTSYPQGLKSALLFSPQH